MKKINLEEILNRTLEISKTDSLTSISKDSIYVAMREFGEQLLKLASENAKVDVSMMYPDTEKAEDVQEVLCDHYHDREWHLSVDKETIINTIDQVE